MAIVVTFENAMVLANSLDDSEFKDSIVASLERKDFTMVLVVSGEAILQTLRRETDLSINELKMRMRNCSRLEKLERMVSVLAREVRAAARERKAAARSAKIDAAWQGLRPTDVSRSIPRNGQPT